MTRPASPRDSLRPEVTRLRSENAALREALEKQWEEAHFDHCGRLHGADKQCLWPRPKVLAETRGDPNAAS